MGLTVLGLGVGSGSTALDDWFQDLGRRHPEVTSLLVFTDGRVMLAVCAVVVVVALIQRRWRLAAVTVLTPVLAVVAARLAKRIFGRLKGGELAYPSGHTTLAVVVVACAVLLVGASVWAVATATAILALAVLGQGVSYHYFTDAIGALFLGSAIACAAARVAGHTSCSPRRHRPVPTDG